MVSDSTAAREARLRRRIAKHDHRLEKTPSRHWIREHYGPGYMVLGGKTVVSGCCRREYDDKLDDAEAFAGRLDATVAP